MTIDELRKRIDEIDRELVRLISERAGLAKNIGLMKTENNRPIYSPEREMAVLRNWLSVPHEPMSDDAVTAIFREVIAVCRAMAAPITVAYWGPPGSFTHIASVKQFGSTTNFLAVDSITDVFYEVQKKNAHHGVVPVENSTEGIIPLTLDMFLQTDLKVCAEVFVPIRHNLVSHAGDIKTVKRIYSSPQPTAQCRGWLRANAPNVPIIEVSTTARAAIAASEDPDSAAIASRLAAEQYGLSLLAEGIEDNPYNRTRFFVLGYMQTPRTGKDKTSIVFSVPHKAGSLHSALKIFQENNVNLTLIESRPTKQMPWEYVFFIDVQGHVEDAPVKNAVESLTADALFLRVLGSYPEAE